MRELDLEVVDDRGPEALRLVDRKPVKLVVVRAAEPPREPRDVRALNLFGRRVPDELGDGRSVRNSLGRSRRFAL
jgi:hypothetical protein